MSKCPECGEPVEERFRLCPVCGSPLGDQSEPAVGVTRELLDEVGFDTRTLPSLLALLRDPARVAESAARRVSHHARPVRLYFTVSFVALVFQVVAGLGSDPTPAAETALPPDELSIQFVTSGPNINVGSNILAAIEQAGGVDAWLEETGRLDRQPAPMRLLLTRAIRLRAEGRFDRVTENYAQNRALISLLMMPLLAVALSLIFFGRANFAGHFNLAVVLATLVLMVDIIRRLIGLGLHLVLPGGAPVGIALTAAQIIATLWYFGRSLEGFYGLGRVRAVLSTPVIVTAMVLGWVAAAFVLNVVFILVA